MKNYMKRIFSQAKPWEIAFWWIFRILMIYAMIKGFMADPFILSDPLQVFANLVAMFAWEIFQMFKPNHFVRHLPSLMQDISVVMIFAASFCGKFLNFYYDVLWWDSAMHLTSGALCAFLGYEVVVSMQKRDKKITSVSIALLCALGFSFFVSTCWELFEFTADQVMCMGAHGDINLAGDAQHWCWDLAQGTPKAHTLLPAYFAGRWPLMDTMQDTILNTIGAIVAWIIMKIFPYHHKGKKNINDEIKAALDAENTCEKELVTK